MSHLRQLDHVAGVHVVPSDHGEEVDAISVVWTL